MTDRTLQAVCPYCGHVIAESYELGEYGKRECGDHECPHCEQTFYWRRIVDVRYSTKKVEGSPR